MESAKAEVAAAGDTKLDPKDYWTTFFKYNLSLLPLRRLVQAYWAVPGSSTFQEQLFSKVSSRSEENLRISIVFALSL